jgi:hypothetical protein
MHGDEHPKRAVLRSGRAQTIERLTDAFARDELGLDEFEDRLNRAYAAEEVPALEALVRDLSLEPVARQTGVATAHTALAPVAPSAPRPRAVAILGSVERRGQWAISGSSGALAVLGSVVIDLRDVVLPPGITVIQVSAVLGSIELIVPPNLAVESDGTSILGSFEGIQRVPRDPDPEAPVLRVQGRAVLGSIEVHTRPPESRMARAALPAKTR